jgi:hypothetical protein
MVNLCGPVYWRLSTEISGLTGCEGSGKGERVQAASGSQFRCFPCSSWLHLCLCHAISVAPHHLALSLARLGPYLGRSVEELQMVFGRADLFPSVTVLMTDALRRRSSSRTSLILLDRTYIQFWLGSDNRYFSLAWSESLGKPLLLRGLAAAPI